MELKTFADTYRLRVRRDGCGDAVILGKLGHLYQHDAGRFGVVFEDTPDGQRANTLRSRRRKALAAGFQMHQMGDAESILLFDPENSEQARLAIRLVGAKRRRIASPAQIEAARKGAAASLFRRKQLAEAAPAS